MITHISEEHGNTNDQSSQKNMDALIISRNSTETLMIMFRTRKYSRYQCLRRIWQHATWHIWGWQEYGNTHNKFWKNTSILNAICLWGKCQDIDIHDGVSPDAMQKASYDSHITLDMMSESLRVLTSDINCHGSNPDSVMTENWYLSLPSLVLCITRTWHGFLDQ